MRTHGQAMKALWLLLLAGLLQLPNAHAQVVYRCDGNRYSQVPCPGGTAVDVDDARSRDQKADQDAATKRSAALAHKLEQERLALGKAARPGQPAKSSAKPNPEPAVASSKPKKKAKPTPEWFVATTEAKSSASKDSKAGVTAPKAGKPSRSESTDSSASPVKALPKG